MILFEWLVIEICIYLLPEQQKERKMNDVGKYYKLSITAGLSKKCKLASLAMFLDITIYGLCIVKKYHFNQQYFKCRVNRHYQERCYDVLSGKSTKCIEFSGKSIEFHRLISGDTMIAGKLAVFSQLMGSIIYSIPISYQICLAVNK